MATKARIVLLVEKGSSALTCCRSRTEAKEIARKRGYREWATAATQVTLTREGVLRFLNRLLG